MVSFFAFVSDIANNEPDQQTKTNTINDWSFYAIYGAIAVVGVTMAYFDHNPHLTFEELVDRLP